nr:hypothetical protein Iba_chr14dCG14690 [Ipomoea batatas]
MKFFAFNILLCRLSIVSYFVVQHVYDFKVIFAGKKYHEEQIAAIVQEKNNMTHEFSNLVFDLFLTVLALFRFCIDSMKPYKNPTSHLALADKNEDLDRRPGLVDSRVVVYNGRWS